MNILQNIFNDNYEIIQYSLHPRDVVMENITKMINCGDPAFGGAMYGCSHCGELKFVPFRCHSKFCPTCGVKYCSDRSLKMSFKLVLSIILISFSIELLNSSTIYCIFFWKVPFFPSNSYVSLRIFFFPHLIILKAFFSSLFSKSTSLYSTFPFHLLLFCFND